MKHKKSKELESIHVLNISNCIEIYDYIILNLQIFSEYNQKKSNIKTIHIYILCFTDIKYKKQKKENKINILC